MKATAMSPMTFQAAAKAHLNELTRDESAPMTAQSTAALTLVYRLFSSYCGDSTLLADVTRAQASEFIASVATLDPTWGRSHRRADNFTLRELLDQHGDGHGHGGLSNRTLNRYASTLAAVWKHAEKRGRFAGANPFDGQSRRTASARDTSYSPFTPDELGTLLEDCTPERAPTVATVHKALDWVIWIAAYSGMRLNEICSLTVEDIVEDQEGVPFFNIVNAKTAAGDRRVPVHSVLIGLGLFDYWQRQRAVSAAWAKRQRGRLGRNGSRKIAAARASAHMLFPALHKGGPDGKHSLYATKLFTKRRRVLGLTREHLAFHSLRCNVATALERAGVPETEAVELLGHRKLSMSYGLYSAGLDLLGLRRVVEAIRYDHSVSATKI